MSILDLLIFLLCVNDQYSLHVNPFILMCADDKPLCITGNIVCYIQISMHNDLVTIWSDFCCNTPSLILPQRCDLY